MNEAPILVIHHAECLDGYTAAYYAAVAAHRRGQEVELKAAYYGEPAPDVVGRKVYVVDFSYKRAELEAMGRSAEWVILLDHHKTAQAELERVKLQCTSKVVFDMERCGARLAWEELARWVEPWKMLTYTPRLVEYIEDGDLGRNELVNTREIRAWIGSHDFSIETWRGIEETLENPERRKIAVDIGSYLIQARAKRVREYAERAQPLMLAGRRALVVNCAERAALTDLTTRLAKECDGIGASFYLRKDGQVEWRLTSLQGGVDVALLARLYGGGGHQHAAGFSCTVEGLSEILRGGPA